MADVFYPKLNQIFNLDSLPDSMEFIKTAIDNLDGFYYRDFSEYVSGNGTHFVYSLKVLTAKELGFNIPGTEFKLVLQPSDNLDINMSEIPIYLSVSIPILGIVKSFDLTNFDYSFQSIINLLKDSFGLTDAGILFKISLYGDGDTPVVDFINLVNGLYNLNIDTTATNQEIISALKQNGTPVLYVFFEQYIVGTNEELDLLLRRYFPEIFPTDVVETLKYLVLPNVRTNVNVNVGLEFPRSILLPVDENNNVLEGDEVKARLDFNAGNIFFSTYEGFGFSEQAAFNLFPNNRAQVGNTGLILGLTNGKIDLSEHKNIVEASLDGRPANFKGVFLQEAFISIPWIKDANGDNINITGSNLLLGNPGGISGNIGVEDFTLTEEPTGEAPGGIQVKIEKFFVNFHQNSITGSGIKIKLTIPGLKKSGTDDDAEFTIEGQYFDNGYSASVNFSGFGLSIGNILDITLYEIGISKFDDQPMQLLFKADFYFASKPGFIGDLLPEGIKINPIVFEQGSGVKSFSIDLDWAETDDTHLEYANGLLDARIPINKSILNFITLNGIRAIIEDHPNGADKRFQLLVDAGMKIGPVTGEASNFGLQGDLNFRHNALPAEGETEVPPLISNLEFVPPTGIGIAVKAEAVKGGGFLSFDHINQRYTGAINLKVGLAKLDFEVNAFGVLVTKLPSGNKGFSLVAIMSATFSPAIQLGLGFTLNGLGGLLGLHRRANTELLRNELNSGRIGDIMFPSNPQGRFAQIISNLEESFPIQENQFIFGPGAKIGWGTPTLITVDMVLLFEVPDPVRVILLGVAKSLLPDEKKPILKLNVNFLAVLDFGKKSLSVDARIYDSALLTFTLDGTMAMRILGGDNPYFLISVGGFHPNFQLPGYVSLPEQRRLSISMLSGNVLSVGAATYYAITSNSVQFGAAIWLKADLSVFKAEGGFSFDALVMFNPFKFCIDVAAYVTIKARLKLKIKVKIKLFKFKVSIKLEDVTLASIGLQGSLCGPSYWEANAVARFSLLGASKSFDFVKQWGKKETVTVPRIDLKQRLITALEDNKNWEVESGTHSDQLVVIRGMEEDSLVLKGTGTLKVKESVLPLKLTIEKFGNGLPKDDNYFEIKQVTLGNSQRSLNADLREVRDFFAPGEFRNLGNRKLSSKSFEKYVNGVVADPPSASGAIDYGAHKIERSMVYESKIIDASSPVEFTKLPTTATILISSETEANGTEFQMKGNSSNRFNRRKNRKQTVRVDKQFSVNEEQFSVVYSEDLQSVNQQYYASEMEAEDAMRELIRQDKSLKNKLIVLPNYAMAS